VDRELTPKKTGDIKMTSMSRQLAAWVADLAYDDLPADVVDRAKGVTLQGLVSAQLGRAMPETEQALAMMAELESGGPGAATVMIDGHKLTMAGAAFVNSEMMFAGGKWDTFRMLTHPGCAILPAGLMAAEVEGASGRDFITGIVAGYEVMERMAADFIPTTVTRGFHPGPVFGIFGAAMAMAKIMGLTADQIHGAIAQCVNLASGNVEGARSGGRSLREGGAVRNALLAVAMGRQGVPGGETALEGEAGFYHSYTGNNRGELKYSFTADNETDLAKVTAGLGSSWMFLETLYRIYSTAGYNIAHIDVTAALCQEHDIDWRDVDRVVSVVNWLETAYPSPAFPTEGRLEGIDGPRYYAAYGVVQRGLPILKDVGHGLGPDDPPEVLAFMDRVTITPSYRHPLFAPEVTIHLKDGRAFTKAATGREFIWNFAGLADRVRGYAPGARLSAEGFEALIETCGNIDGLAKADQLIEATIPAG